jgi:histidyl-tRNA synthetase
MNIKAPRGTYDILPEKAKAWHRLEETAVSVFERYGYSRIVTPTFEHTELFQRGIGEATEIVQKEMYTFEDRGGRSLTLRPEGTAPVVRAYLEHNLGAQLPAKLYYAGPMYRYERPQAGRYREFWQVGAEAIGSVDPALDAEVILLLIHYLRNVGLQDLELYINSMGCQECRPRFIQEVKADLAPNRNSFCDDCVRRLDDNPLRMFDCKKKQCQEILDNAPKISEFLCSSCLDHFESVQSYLHAVGIQYKTDPGLVRGFDYYTKTTFEVTSDRLGAQNALGGGGRYDQLIEQFGGPETPGIGFAIGLERVLLALSEESERSMDKPEIDVFIAALGHESKQRAFDLLYRLRIEGISSDTDFLNRSLRSQMKHAHKRGAGYTILIGSDELQKGICGIRDMDNGTQLDLPFEKCVEWIKTKLEEREQNSE